MKRYLLIFFIIGVVFVGCYNDNYTELYPAQSIGSLVCDTANITYGNQVSSILNSYCNSCHSASIANGGIVLDNYNDVLSCAQSGKLVGTIVRPATDRYLMPPNSQLDQCSINTIVIWVNKNEPK